MKHFRKFVMILALVATAATAAPVPSSAGRGVPAMPADGHAADVSDPVQDRWWGVIAAIGCGIGIRWTRVSGNLYVAGGTIVLCLIALADAVTS